MLHRIEPDVCRAAQVLDPAIEKADRQVLMRLGAIAPQRLDALVE